MGELSNLLSGGTQNAYSDEAQAYGNIPGQLQPYYQQGQAQLQPYQQAGQAALNPYQNVLNQIQGQTNGQWMNQYQQSPYAKYLTNTGLNSMNNAAAATGTLGSGANQQQNAQLSSQIAGQDMQNYFNNMQSQNQMQLGGWGDLIHGGQQAAGQSANMYGQLGNNIASILAGQASANLNSQIGQGQGKQSGFGDLAGLIGGDGGTFGAGGALGDILPFASGSVI